MLISWSPFLSNCKKVIITYFYYHFSSKSHLPRPLSTDNDKIVNKQKPTHIFTTSIATFVFCTAIRCHYQSILSLFSSTPWKIPRFFTAYSRFKSISLSLFLAPPKDDVCFCSLAERPHYNERV